MRRNDSADRFGRQPGLGDWTEAPAFDSAQVRSSIEPETSPSHRNNSPLLTTGADLLQGTSDPAEVPKGFPVGMTVRHPRYGLGRVVAVGGFAKRRTVTVEFDEGERSETFMVSKCPLQPVGDP